MFEDFIQSYECEYTDWRELLKTIFELSGIDYDILEAEVKKE